VVTKWLIETYTTMPRWMHGWRMVLRGFKSNIILIQ
jgi:hypothetical protein